MKILTVGYLWNLGQSEFHHIWVKSLLDIYILIWSLLCVHVLVTQWCLTARPWTNCSLPGSSVCLWNSPGKITGVGSHCILQGIFPTQGSNLLHCRQILYCLRYQGSPVIIIVTDWLYVKRNVLKSEKMKKRFHCEILLDSKQS